jgi:hypothetical protein
MARYFARLLVPAQQRLARFCRELLGAVQEPLEATVGAAGQALSRAPDVGDLGVARDGKGARVVFADAQRALGLELAGCFKASNAAQPRSRGSASTRTMVSRVPY